MISITGCEAFALLGEASDVARELSQRVDFLSVALGLEQLDNPVLALRSEWRLLGVFYLA